MTEIDLAAVIDPVRAQLPGLRPDGLLARSLKCFVIAGSLDGRPVVLKWLARPEPPWTWYFEREQRLLAAFAAAGEGSVAPELLASGPRWMVLSRCSGTALVAGRFASHADASAVAAALAARRRLACTTTPWPDVPQDDRTRAEIRARLLEDPCDGLGWCLAGLARGAALGLVDRADAALAIDALRRWPVLARSHGDLLPRNVILDGAVARLVDLECAGDHPEAWDHALLWANVPAAARRRVQNDFSSRPIGPDLSSRPIGPEFSSRPIGPDFSSRPFEPDFSSRPFGPDFSSRPFGPDFGDGPLPRRRAFWACVVFALVRELKFARGARLAAELRDTLRHAVKHLRA